MKAYAKIILLSLVNKFSFYEKWTNKLCCILLAINLKDDILRCGIFFASITSLCTLIFHAFLSCSFCTFEFIRLCYLFFNFLFTFTMCLKSVKTFWYDQAGLATLFCSKIAQLCHFSQECTRFFKVSYRKKILKDPPPHFHPPPLNSCLWKIYIKPWLLDLTLFLSFGGVLSWFWGFCCLSLMALLARKMWVCALMLEKFKFFAGLTRSLRVIKSAQYQGSLLVKETVQRHLCLETIFAVRQSYKMNNPTLFC